MPTESSANQYSATWFEAFLPPGGAVAGKREIAFLQRWLPMPAHRRVLDLCCGIGRHAQVLAELGYVVTGLDRSLPALRRAAANRRGVRYLQADMRRIPFAPGSFDAVLCLWQSFGYFDEAANRQVLRAMASVLSPGGRLILDVYRRALIAAHPGCRRIIKDSHEVIEQRCMVGDRLQVKLEYVGRAQSETFDWQLFEPDQLCEMAKQAHLTPLAACADFDETIASSQEQPRMQLVFEARSEGRSR